MSVSEWIVAILHLILLIFPLLLMIKYTSEIVHCKKTSKAVDNEAIVKLITVSIIFVVGVFIFIMQYVA